MDTKVVIMCGGIGKRMRPMTTDKSLLEFAGKPLIVHHIESAVAAGLDKFVVIANPENSEGIRNILSGFHDITIDYAIQQKPGGMSNALLSATQLLSGNPFILVNSNDIFTKYIQTGNFFQPHGFSHFIFQCNVRISTGHNDSSFGFVFL